MYSGPDCMDADDRMLMGSAHAWVYAGPSALSALGEAHWIAMQAFNTSARDTHKFAHLYSHTLVG